ncbi:MAG: BREX system P-loop protein BrxC [Nostoc sp. TH1S01]|nr:BREX system P-loop protein BrxC [Nostoc sp. TH1S01]
MNTIGELLARDLRKPIEEIIKVNQVDEESVYTEITEYVATDRIIEQYRSLLKAIAEAPSEAHEDIGVWVSGFFGSGKSSFAKNLGYVLANRTVRGTPASDLFKHQVSDRRLGEFLDFINTSIPTEVIMFDVSVDRAVKRTNERIAEVMYTVLLRELDYAEDYDIAELEIELERECKLDEFINSCQQIYNIEWRVVRKGAQKIARASAILHAIDSVTYPTADSWSQTLRNKSADITVGKFVERTFDLCARRRPGKALVFIVDEVGQYVARSADKIEDLRAVVEQFGKVGKNLLKTKKTIAPIWVVVTSQEKLDEVVAAIDDKRVELAKLQDRFKQRIDMAPADIREVATRRVLSKKEEAVPVLEQLFRQSQGQLNAACRLERTTRKSEVNEADFVQFYPYLPHFIELSIEIMSGIRLQPGAPKHYGGSNRTIIKQAYEMLVSERTAFAKQFVGKLVTLDKIYELVEANLSTEKRNDIDGITQRFKDSTEDNGMAARVGKVICLLEFVRDLPRTVTNIAACLIDDVGQPAPVAAVEKSINLLYEAKFIRNTEEGWKLQTAQEKNWETDRRAYSPRPRDRNESIREALRDIFGDVRLRTYRYKDLRNFPVGIKFDGNSIYDGQVPLNICSATDSQEYAAKVTDIRNESRQDSHQNEIYWLFSLTEEIDNLVAEVYKSRQMVAKYDQMRVQNRATNEELACLQTEKSEVLRYQRRLIEKLEEALIAGTGFFRGVSKDGSDLGKTLNEIFKELFDFAVPDLYPKLEIGARNLKGTEAEEILKAANLNGLSQVFYSGESSLNLVIKDGAKYVPNPEADVAKEVLDYLVQQHSYGNKETRTGKALESRFGGLGYGWDRDILRLVLAVLFRAGSIEVSHKGQRFDSYQNANSREPFTNNTAFKSALFTPVKPISLSTLKQAVENYEDLTGDTVDMDKNAISAVFKQLATEELQLLFPVEAQVKANSLPVLDQLEDYRNTLTSIQNGTADDCVQILVGEGVSLKEARDRFRRIREATNESSISTIQAAKRVANNQWSVVSNQKPEIAEVANRLRENLDAEYFVDRIPEIKADAEIIAKAYAEGYVKIHTQRTQEYQKVIEEIKGRSEWTNIPPEQQEVLLNELQKRACTHDLATDENWSLTANECSVCRATIAQMESDLAALSGLKSQVLFRIQELTAITEEKEVVIERVRLGDFYSETIDSEEAVEQVVERLREHLLDLVSKGVKIILE